MLFICSAHSSFAFLFAVLAIIYNYEGACNCEALLLVKCSHIAVSMKMMCASLQRFCWRFIDSLISFYTYNKVSKKMCDEKICLYNDLLMSSRPRP